jgi:hypothetical protein
MHRCRLAGVAGSARGYGTLDSMDAEADARARAFSAIRMALEAGRGRPYEDLFQAYSGLVEEHYRATEGQPERRTALAALTLSTCAKAAALLVTKLAQATDRSEDEIVDEIRVALAED